MSLIERADALEKEFQIAAAEAEKDPAKAEPLRIQWLGRNGKVTALMELLRTAHELVRGRGHALVQADLTVITEAPRLGPHLPAMASSLTGRLGLPPGAIGIKAKTNEGMGFIGKGEGLAVIAVALLEAR